MSVRLSVCLSVYLSVRLSVCALSCMGAPLQMMSVLVELQHADQFAITEGDQPVWGSVDDDVAGRAEC